MESKNWKKGSKRHDDAERVLLQPGGQDDG